MVVPRARAKLCVRTRELIGSQLDCATLWHEKALSINTEMIGFLSTI